MRKRALAWAIVAWLAAGAPAPAWNAHGHRVITHLALDALPAAVPPWMRDPVVRDMIVYQSGEPDRWRGTRLPALAHENVPDHYIDAELLPDFGLTLRTLPPLRNEYLKAMVLAKQEHPERVRPYDAADDPDRTREWPGFLPHAIAEHHAKLVASLRMARTLEALGEPPESPRLRMARSNAAYHMGLLAHFVGDGAQPLHMTVHHHGWTGPNPEGYTTDRGFHAYIDGTVLEVHAIDHESMRSTARPPVPVDADPWDEVIAYLERSFERVEPLYRLERDGALDDAEGEAFLRERIADAGAMLAGLYAAAWAHSEPSDADIAAFLKFDRGRRP